MHVKNTPGKRIIELCKTYSLSLEELSVRSGVPIELIQRITEDETIPGLAPLVAISRSLGVRLGTLLDDHDALGPVITRAGAVGDSVRFITGVPGGGAGVNQGLTFKPLAPDKVGRHMEPFIIDFASDSEQKLTAHEGEEFIYVISGNLAMEYGSVSDVLHEGDSVYYDSIVPHRVISADGNPVRILAVVYTPI